MTRYRMKVNHTLTNDFIPSEDMENMMIRLSGRQPGEPQSKNLRVYWPMDEFDRVWEEVPESKPLRLQPIRKEEVDALDNYFNRSMINHETHTLIKQLLCKLLAQTDGDKESQDDRRSNREETVGSEVQHSGITESDEHGFNTEPRIRFGDKEPVFFGDRVILEWNEQLESFDILREGHIQYHTRVKRVHAHIVRDSGEGLAIQMRDARKEPESRQD